jgi:mevalonate pyrophosphate decarboxylase
MFTRDLLERTIRTFIQAALAVLVTNVAGVTDLDTAKAAGLAALAAGFSAVVALVAKSFGSPDNASFQSDI